LKSTTKIKYSEDGKMNNKLKCQSPVVILKKQGRWCKEFIMEVLTL